MSDREKLVGAAVAEVAEGVRAACDEAHGEPGNVAKAGGARSALMGALHLIQGVYLDNVTEYERTMATRGGRAMLDATLAYAKPHVSPNGGYSTMNQKPPRVTDAGPDGAEVAGFVTAELTRALEWQAREGADVRADARRWMVEHGLAEPEPPRRRLMDSFDYKRMEFRARRALIGIMWAIEGGDWKDDGSKEDAEALAAWLAEHAPGAES